FEHLDADVGDVNERRLQHLLALFEVEQRLRFLGVADDRDDDLVEMPGRAFDDVDMAERHRIERTGAEGGRHAVSPISGNKTSKAYRRTSAPSGLTRPEAAPRRVAPGARRRRSRPR